MAFEIAELQSSPEEPIQVLLTNDGSAGVRALCEWSTTPDGSTRVAGRVASAELREPLVRIKDLELLTPSQPTRRGGTAPPARTACVADGIDVRVRRSAIHAAHNGP